MTVFFRAVMAYQQAVPEAKTVKAWHLHYQSLTVVRLAKYFRNITNLEGLLKTAEWSGDATLVDKAEQAYARFNKRTAALHLTDYYEEIGLDKIADGERIVNHGVTGCEEIKLPVLLYIYTGRREYLDAAVTGMEKLLSDHLLPTGVPSSEEFFSGTGATRAYESCVISDFAWTLGYYLLATGEGRWADHIEKAIFNALPGSIAKDFTTMQYLSSGNQVVIDGFAHKGAMLHGVTAWRQYRPNHYPQCCPANIQRAMPNYLLRMWLQTPDGAPVAAMYGPSECKFLFHGKTIRICEETEYPFGESITFRLFPETTMEFPLTMRIPGWCEKASLKINGKEHKPALRSGEFVTLQHRFSPGDTVALRLPMQPKIKTDRQRNLSVERGPLLYAYPVPAQVEKETPKKRFSPLRITPKAPWNYAVAPNPEITEIAGGSTGYPLDPDGVRLKLKIPVQTIGNYDELESGRDTPDIPLFYHLTGEERELELQPLGSTMARIATFPPAENRLAIPVVTAHARGPVEADFRRPLPALPWEKLTSEEFYAQEALQVQPNRNGFYDLIHHFRRQGELVALMQFRLYSDTDTDAELAVTASDRAEIMLNGIPIASLAAVGCAEFHTPEFIPVTLHAGYNFLRVKVADGPRPSQYRDSWGMAIAAFITIK